MAMQNNYLLKIFLFILIFFTGVSSSWAFCFDEAGRKFNVSPALLKAIAKVESSLNPNAVNYNKNGSYDFGLMQINNWWQKSLGDYWYELSDPCYNVVVGAWILKQCFSQFGCCWDAVACYNTGKPISQLTGQKKENAWKYIRKVQKAMKENND